MRTDTFQPSHERAKTSLFRGSRAARGGERGLERAAEHVRDRRRGQRAVRRAVGVEDAHEDRLRPDHEEVLTQQRSLDHPSLVEHELERRRQRVPLRSLRGRDDEDERVLPALPRHAVPRGRHGAAQGGRQRRRRTLDRRAPRGPVGEGGDLPEQDVAHVAAARGLDVESRRRPTRGGDEQERVEIRLMLVEQHEERPRGVRVRPVRQVDDVIAGARSRRLRGLEPGVLLRVESGLDLGGPRALRVAPQVPLRRGQPAAFAPCLAVDAVVREIVRRGGHLPRHGTRGRRGEGRDERGRAGQGCGRRHRSPTRGTPASGTNRQNAHSLGSAGAVSLTYDA